MSPVDARRLRLDETPVRRAEAMLVCCGIIFWKKSAPVTFSFLQPTRWRDIAAVAEYITITGVA
jgi:hypothetical protein